MLASMGTWVVTDKISSSSVSPGDFSQPEKGNRKRERERRGNKRLLILFVFEG
jgi:hypothetical protein